jgi:hypothetical protein
MNSLKPDSGSHDPVSALSEAEATGETAAIFTDIRRTMQIPLITSIWRTLAGIEGGLDAVWKVAKPLFETGQPAAAHENLREETVLPVPESLVEGQLFCAGVTTEDLAVIRSLIQAYNRSNGMNLMALTGLISIPAYLPACDPVPPDPPPWLEPPALPEKKDISPAMWTFLEQINRLGSVPGETGLATLWRHLSHWPGFLAVVHAAFAPLERKGTIRRSIEQVLEIAGAEGQRIAALRGQTVLIPEPARRMIGNYVLNPGLVARMVSIGLGLDHWLESEA